MLQDLHESLKKQLLAIDGMTTRPHASVSENNPKDGIEEFLLNGTHFAGLRLTDKYLMLYLMPLYSIPDLDAQFGERLRAVRSGKSCLKITKPEKLDRDAVDQILTQGAANWNTIPS